MLIKLATGKLSNAIFNEYTMGPHCYNGRNVAYLYNGETVSGGYDAVSQCDQICRNFTTLVNL